MPIFTQGFAFVTLAKTYDVVLDPEGAVETPMIVVKLCQTTPTNSTRRWNYLDFLSFLSIFSNTVSIL